MARLDTLPNVEQNWSIDDLYDAHEALDAEEEAKRFAMEQRK